MKTNISLPDLSFGCCSHGGTAVVVAVDDGAAVAGDDAGSWGGCRLFRLDPPCTCFPSDPQDLP